MLLEEMKSILKESKYEGYERFEHEDVDVLWDYVERSRWLRRYFKEYDKEDFIEDISKGHLDYLIDDRMAVIKLECLVSLGLHNIPLGHIVSYFEDIVCVKTNKNAIEYMDEKLCKDYVSDFKMFEKSALWDYIELVFDKAIPFIMGSVPMGDGLYDMTIHCMGMYIVELPNDVRYALGLK